MKTDVEVKPEIKSPAYKVVTFKLSNCGRFGAIMSGKDTLRWIASRDEGIKFVREASAYESIISYVNREKLIRFITKAECLAMREDQVDFYVRTSVEELNRDLETYQGLRQQMYRIAKDTDKSLCQRISADRSPHN